MRKCAINAVLLLFSVIFTVGFYCRAQNSQPTEYQIKAAFIYNFARFVDWPTQVFADASSPLIIGVLGRNDFGPSLAQTISGKTVQGHPLQFEMFPSLSQATNCQVLFISASERSHVSKIISTLGAARILTVGETDDFIARGGMIRLRIVDDKVRFDINNSAAKSAGLTISSKLLTLAINVR